MELLLRSFLAHFITKPALSAKTRAQDVEYNLPVNHLADRDLHIGNNTRTLLDELMENGTVSPIEEKEFYKLVVLKGFAT